LQDAPEKATLEGVRFSSRPAKVRADAEKA
jgi:hypothetical protein